MPRTKAAEDGYSSRALRLVLVAGFCGIFSIFLVATIDAVRLLGAMRAENKILREASLERTNHLGSLRSSIQLTQTYLSDYLLNSDQQKSSNYLENLKQLRSQMQSELASYRSSTLDEKQLVQRLSDLLDQHWQHLSRALSLPPAARAPAYLYNEQILPLRSAVVEITTRLEEIDARQTASTELEIQNQFERLGSRLSVVLNIALGAVVLLAGGCLLYIFRIERQNRRRYRELLQTREALEQLSARLVDAQETERRTISRELHDQVGQTLNALLVDAANLAKRIPPSDSLSQRYLNNIRTFADSSVNSIRDIALLLRPSMLDDLGLIPALEWQAREVSRRTGIRVTVEAGNVSDHLPDDVRTCVYRIVQEALHNVERHSKAKSTVVTVKEEEHSLSLSVEDDGAGFDPKRVRGMGMLGMEERVRQLGGRLEIQSSAGKGTTLRASVPIPVAVTE